MIDTILISIVATTNCIICYIAVKKYLLEK